MLWLLFIAIIMQLVFGYYIFFYVFEKYNDNRKKWMLQTSIVLFLAIAFLVLFNILHEYYLLFSLMGLNIIFGAISFLIVRKSVLNNQKKLMQLDLIMNITVPLFAIFIFIVFQQNITFNELTYSFNNIENISFGVLMSIVILFSILLTISIHVTFNYYIWGINSSKNPYDPIFQLTNRKTYITSGLIGMIVGIIILSEARLSLSSELLENYYQTLDIFKSIFIAFALPSVYNYLVNKNK